MLPDMTSGLPQSFTSVHSSASFSSSHPLFPPPSQSSAPSTPHFFHTTAESFIVAHKPRNLKVVTSPLQPAAPPSFSSSSSSSSLPAAAQPAMLSVFPLTFTLAFKVSAARIKRRANKVSPALPRLYLTLQSDADSTGRVEGRKFNRRKHQSAIGSKAIHREPPAGAPCIMLEGAEDGAWLYVVETKGGESRGRRKQKYGLLRTDAKYRLTLLGDGSQAAAVTDVMMEDHTGVFPVRHYAADAEEVTQAQAGFRSPQRSMKEDDEDEEDEAEQAQQEDDDDDDDDEQPGLDDTVEEERLVQQPYSQPHFPPLPPRPPPYFLHSQPPPALFPLPLPYTQPYWSQPAPQMFPPPLAYAAFPQPRPSLLSAPMPHPGYDYSQRTAPSYQLQPPPPPPVSPPASPNPEASPTASPQPVHSFAAHYQHSGDYDQFAAPPFPSFPSSSSSSSSSFSSSFRGRQPSEQQPLFSTSASSSTSSSSSSSSPPPRHSRSSSVSSGFFSGAQSSGGFSFASFLPSRTPSPAQPSSAYLPDQLATLFPSPAPTSEKLDSAAALSLSGSAMQAGFARDVSQSSSSQLWLGQDDEPQHGTGAASLWPLIASPPLPPHPSPEAERWDGSASRSSSLSLSCISLHSLQAADVELDGDYDAIEHGQEQQGWPGQSAAAPPASDPPPPLQWTGARSGDECSSETDSSDITAEEQQRRSRRQQMASTPPVLQQPELRPRGEELGSLRRALGRGEGGHGLAGNGSSLTDSEGEEEEKGEDVPAPSGIRRWWRRRQRQWLLQAEKQVEA